MDVLDGLDELKVCTAYRHGDALLDAPPARADMMADLVPVYETVAGWGEETCAVTQALTRCLQRLKSTSA